MLVAMIYRCCIDIFLNDVSRQNKYLGKRQRVLYEKVCLSNNSIVHVKVLSEMVTYKKKKVLSEMVLSFWPKKEKSALSRSRKKKKGLEIRILTL